jgi:hypothetical protein
MWSPSQELAYAKKIIIKLRPSFIPFQKAAGKFRDVFQYFWIKIYSGLLKTFDNRIRFRRAARM